MYCRHCGKEINDNSSFCVHCGGEIRKKQDSVNVVEEAVETQAVPEEVQAEPVDVQNSVQNEEAVQKEKPVPSKKKKKTAIIVSSCAAAVLIVAAAVFVFFNYMSIAAISDEKAEVFIDDAKEAILSGDYDTASDILGKIRLKEDTAFAAELEELKNIAKLAPEVKSVDTSDYPNVTVVLACSEDVKDFANTAFLIGEEGEELSVRSVEADGKNLTLTYTSNVTYDERKQESKLKFTNFTVLDFSVPFEYQTVLVQDANLAFVTSNVTNYPEVSVYFRVEDEYGNPIDGLSQKTFRVRERLDINDYMEREILAVSKLDGAAALNVSLVIDRSSSISDNDMSKIKSTTNEFLSKMQFSSGDKAGVIAFDSYVMEMCTFTNNRDFLTNGVNSMHPYGLTACYDAIVKGINNAANQSGARCVIAFTDGMDNESVNSASSVINLAKQKSVPVYIIGVGSGVEETVLRNIATSTGGTYHHIDDVSAMSDVYDEIYREQKSMYCITYKSSESIGVSDARTILLDVAGRGYIGSCEREYTPVIPVTTAQHTSRYEVIPAEVSWEEANNLCNQKGGHLATITSQAEADTVIKLAEASGKTYIWLGGYTTNSYGMTTVGHWITGEPWSFDMWMEGEPSRFDAGVNGDGAPEFYLMLWKVNGEWSWNDQRNDLINSEFSNMFKNKMAYVIEYEE